LTCVESLLYSASPDKDYGHLCGEEQLMNPAAEIESVARSYLEGERTLPELEEWLAPNLPILFHFPESDFVSRLAARMELGIAEMDAEGLGESHLKDAIGQLLHDRTAVMMITPAVPEPGTTNSLELSEVAA
jgi:hypothetical protein